MAAVYWREILGDRLVLAHLIVGGLFIVASICIDCFAPHSSWIWILEELVELLGLAAIAGAFALCLNAARHKSRPWRRCLPSDWLAWASALSWPKVRLTGSVGVS